MKCWYQVRGESWQKGVVVSTRSGRDARFIPEVGSTEILLVDVEIILSSDMIVTGYFREEGEEMFRLMSVDVSPGWRSPED